jgi:hypothetical protein
MEVAIEQFFGLAKIFNQMAVFMIKFTCVYNLAFELVHAVDDYLFLPQRCVKLLVKLLMLVGEFITLLLRL